MRAFDETLLRESESLIGRDGVAEVAERFAHLTGELAAAVASGDLTAIEEAAHAVAGCARYLGLPVLGLHCREIMASCRAGDVPATATLTAPLPAMLAEARSWLGGQLAGL